MLARQSAKLQRARLRAPLSVEAYEKMVHDWERVRVFLLDACETYLDFVCDGVEGYYDDDIQTMKALLIAKTLDSIPDYEKWTAAGPRWYLQPWSLPGFLPMRHPIYDELFVIAPTGKKLTWVSADAVTAAVDIKQFDATQIRSRNFYDSTNKEKRRTIAAHQVAPDKNGCMHRRLFGLDVFTLSAGICVRGMTRCFEASAASTNAATCGKTCYTSPRSRVDSWCAIQRSSTAYIASSISSFRVSEGSRTPCPPVCLGARVPVARTSIWVLTIPQEPLTISAYCCGGSLKSAKRSRSAIIFVAWQRLSIL